jgi:hypothetical protein
VGEVASAETIPLDIYVLFDQSGSMSSPADTGNRLDAVRAAAADFLRARESAGIGVGIGYFGYQPLGEASCDPNDYDDPAVPIAKLPDNAGALLQSLNAVVPTGETPTGAAVRGACSAATSWLDDNPGHAVVMLVITDGVPEAPISMANGCSPTLPDAVAATEACLADSGIPVYVLGVGPSLRNLNQIAEAGGTEHAYLVEGGNVSEQVLQALSSIRGNAIPCEFEIPDPPAGQTLKFDEINVSFEDSDGDVNDILNVQQASRCDAKDGGWYYDDANSPQRIMLCDATCDLVSAESAGGEFSFALGCGTIFLQ